MENIKQSVFGALNKGVGYIIIAYSFLCFLLVSNGYIELVTAMMLFFSFLGFLGYYGIALGAIIISGPFISEFSSGYMSILPYIVFSVSLFVKMLQKRFSLKSFGIFLICSVYALISYISGYEPDVVYLLLQIVCIFLFYTISNSFSIEEISITIFSYICGGLLILLYIYSGGVTTFYTETGRLGFGEHIKTLSFICAIPMVFLLFSILNRSYLFDNMTKKINRIIEVILFLVLLLAVIMTLARGLIIAVLIGTLLMLVLTKKSGNTILGFLVVTVVTMWAYSYVESLDALRIDRLFAYDEFASGNGRTEIWLKHLTSMKELGFHYVLMGVGPGNISRIPNTMDAYAHSMIFDYFFSYGIIGFLTFLIVEFVTLKKLYIKNNVIPFVVIIVFLLAYLTHGGAPNITFFVLQGLMLAYARQNDISVIKINTKIK